MHIKRARCIGQAIRVCKLYGYGVVFQTLMNHLQDWFQLFLKVLYVRKVYKKHLKTPNRCYLSIQMQI